MYLIRLSLQVLLSLAVGPEIPEDTAHRVWQHDLDLRVHVLQEAACPGDGAASAASSHKVGHTALGLHPDLHPAIHFVLVCIQICTQQYTSCWTTCRMRRVDDEYIPTNHYGVTGL